MQLIWQRLVGFHSAIIPKRKRAGFYPASVLPTHLSQRYRWQTVINFEDTDGTIEHGRRELLRSMMDGEAPKVSESDVCFCFVFRLRIAMFFPPTPFWGKATTVYQIPKQHIDIPSAFPSAWSSMRALPPSPTLSSQPLCRQDELHSRLMSDSDGEILVR